MNQSWLLILDNADGEPNEIARYLPSGNRGSVIITSRNPNMQLVPHDAFAEIERMEERDAIVLLAKTACRPSEVNQPEIQLR